MMTMTARQSRRASGPGRSRLATRHPELIATLTAEPGKLTLEDVDRWSMSPAEALRYATRCAGAGGPTIHRDAEPGNADVDQGLLASAFAWIDEARSAQPLPAPLQRALGAELGVDLSRVRVHTDTAAAEAAAALGARAFTRGEDIYFAAGAYRPGDAAGVRLIAHEVAHVAQSYRGEVPSGASPVSRPDDAHERDAEAFAGSFEPDRAHDLAPPGSAPAPAAGTQQIARSTDAWQERRDAANEHAEDVMDDIPAGVTGTYAGKLPAADNSHLYIDAIDLPTLGDLLTSLRLLRAREPGLAVAAVKSVADRAEMLPMRAMFETKTSTEVELPASYLTDPPTDEVTVFIALHAAIATVEEFVRKKMRQVHEETEGIYDDGMIETADEHDARKWSELAVAMLDGLTANFGGSIGFFVASLLTSDPDRIAAATAFGATVGDMVGATKVGPKKPGKSKPKGRKGGKTHRGNKGGTGGGKTGGSSRRVKRVDGPPFGKLKDHARRHGLPGQSTNEYYNAAVEHTKTGRPFEVRHDGRTKTAYVTRTGDTFTFTSTSASGGRIYTHMYKLDAQYLRSKGITLPDGF